MRHTVLCFFYENHQFYFCKLMVKDGYKNGISHQLNFPASPTAP
jgi:hypothetical protein